MLCAYKSASYDTLIVKIAVPLHPKMSATQVLVMSTDAKKQ